MKIINWLIHPQVPDIRYLDTPVLSIEVESMGSSKKSKKAYKIQNNITFTIQNKDQNRTNK